MTSYERFKDEIKIIEQLQGMIGILPIIDYNLPDYHKKEQTWYVMCNCQLKIPPPYSH